MKSFPTSIEVVAAALLDGNGRVLMQRRPAGKAHGGLWEFPGGKVERGESRETALIRELHEELGIAVEHAALAPFASANGAGADDAASVGLVMDLYTVRSWQGEPRNLDAEAIGWFDANELMRLEMPPLDIPLAKRIAQLLK